MSEAETSSSRLRRGAKQRNSYGGTAAAPGPLGGVPGVGGAVAARPRTSPSQPGRSPGPGGGGVGTHRQILSSDIKYHYSKSYFVCTFKAYIIIFL